jgi:hypothetical protein
MTRFVLLFWQLRSFLLWGALSYENTGLSLYMLLALASAVFLGSEFFTTRGHILLPQIWDFPFRRLLRLAGSRWRYSTPPRWSSLYKPGMDRTENVSSIIACSLVAGETTCPQSSSLATAVLLSPVYTAVTRTWSCPAVAGFSEFVSQTPLVARANSLSDSRSRKFSIAVTKACIERNSEPAPSTLLPILTIYFPKIYLTEELTL